MKLSDAFKRFRKTLGITQKQAAYGAGIAERLYQSYEYGKVIPSATVLVSLADYFNVPLDYLVGRGIFEGWDKIMENWPVILSSIKGACPALKDLEWDAFEEKDLIRLLPTIIEHVDFSQVDGHTHIDITFYPLYSR